MGQQPRLGGRDLGKALLKSLCDTCMRLLPSAAQQGAVGGILHQRMLEGVFRVGWHATTKDQLSADQLGQGLVQLLRRHRRDRADQLM